MMKRAGVDIESRDNEIGAPHLSASNMSTTTSDSETYETNDENDENEDDNDEVFKKTSRSQKQSNLRKDYGNIALLMFLYMLQGLPLGLSSSLPYILSSKKVSYADQGTFSFAFWPFSMKLLWAPLVDSIFLRSFGRRKSW
jgi:hypothetical protein